MNCFPGLLRNNTDNQGINTTVPGPCTAGTWTIRAHPGCCHRPGSTLRFSTLQTAVEIIEHSRMFEDRRGDSRRLHGSYAGYDPS
ncbi:hypothetical protein DPMN_124085 [Dreissena polymorpha]|uniref:Uncharacterized protein n=1 Tax=Dreissena polymorpha TaxID=45954 RepID=A0A9D4GS36_DREPO|nr:hypothetical protein DPMN_124085 [Dreissena polymorpha]